MKERSGLLVITELYLPTKGGTAVWFDEVYRRFGGKDVHILTAETEDSPEHDRGHPNTIHRLILKRYRFLFPESLWMYIKFLFAALWITYKNKLAQIHAGRVLPEGMIALLVARLLGRKCLVYAHGEEITTWKQALKYKVMRFVYAHVNHVIANSQFTFDELIKMGIKKEKITIISPGVDTERFRPGLECDDLRAKCGVAGKARLILSVGRLSRRKGFDQVIKSLPLLLENKIDVRYALIGVGEDKRYLSELANAQGISDRVYFLGHVSMEDLPRWYNAADVFAMPNREINGDTEGFGMVFIEAAACGTPSVAGIAGGTGDAVVGDMTGIRVDGDNSAAVTGGLKMYLVKENENYRTIIRGAVRNSYDWSIVCDKTSVLSDTVLCE